MKYTYFKKPEKFNIPDTGINVFRKLDEETAKAYFQWFLSIREERIKTLEEAVKTTPGFENWQADFTPNSLVLLQKWFESVIEKRSTTEDEKLAYQQSFTGTKIVPGTVESPQWYFTDFTISVINDISIYYGELFTHNNPSLTWWQDTERKTNADRNYPVIRGFIKSPLNPRNPISGTAARIFMEKEPYNWLSTYNDRLQFIKKK